MFQNTEFEFDGVNGSAFGLYLVNIDSEERESTYLPDREIKESYNGRTGVSYFYGASKSALEFTIKLAREDEWDIDTRRMVIKWLFQPTFKKFVSLDTPLVEYYVIATGSKIVTVGNIERYIEVTFRCNAPWGFMGYNGANETYAAGVGKNIVLENITNVYQNVKPIIVLTPIVAATTITIQSLGNKFQTMSYKTAAASGNIYTIDTETKQIYYGTGGTKTHYIKDFNMNWPILVPGGDTFRITADQNCNIQIEYKVPLSI